MKNKEICVGNSVDYVANHFSDFLKKGYCVCIWGTEDKGTRLGAILLERCGIPIDCYCDSNENKWGKEIISNKFCISPKELIKNSDHCICIVMVNDVDTPQIVVKLKKYGVKYCCGFYDLLCSDYALHCFYPFTLKERKINSNKRRISSYKPDSEIQIRDRVAVYTCIVGGYDMVLPPKKVEENCDYYMISDYAPQNNLYKWIPLSALNIPQGLSSSLINRFCKINAHKIFPSYKYSIYVDGNVFLKQEICQKYLAKLENHATGIACLKRQTRISDIYQDSIHVIISEVDKEEKVQKQMERYWNEGLPQNHGQLCGRILVREHNHPICMRIMEDWWHEVSTQSYRDQLSFMYAVWKNGFSHDDIGWLDVGGWENEDYIVKQHLKDMKTPL